VSENKEENKKSVERHLDSVSAKATKALSAFSTAVAFLLFIALAGFAVMSIVEISARTNYHYQIQERINHINSDLADKPLDMTNFLLTNKRRYYYKLANKVEDLIDSGSKHSMTNLYGLRMIADSGIERLEAGLGELKGEQEKYRLFNAFNFRDFSAENSSYTKENPDISFSFSLRHPIEYIKSFSSDYLLAIVLMACGALGAIIHAVRADGRFSFYSLFVGVSTGFILFLALKGGKNVFLVQSIGSNVAYNPYSSAFFALLAGLFSERTFEILRIIMDTIFNKLKKAVGEI